MATEDNDLRQRVTELERQVADLVGRSASDRASAVTEHAALRDEVSQRLASMTLELGANSSALAAHSRELRTIQGRLESIEANVLAVKGELGDVKRTLTQQSGQLGDINTKLDRLLGDT